VTIGATEPEFAKALRVAGAGIAAAHGCRSTFKDCCSERTSFPSEVSGMALAHAIWDKTEAAPTGAAS
jgi:hypothetical protein